MRAPVLLLCCSAAFAQTWVAQTSGVDVSLRGISAVSPEVAWASGAKGTFLKTTDGGTTWAAASMPGATDLDFRDVHAVDAKTAYLMSAGKGPQSRIYKTTNGGQSWALQATNLDPRGFWDCMSFWDESHGMIVGDPVDGRFAILTTRDGATWKTIKGPKANEDEALFAASGTCLFTRGTREAWFGTGGKDGGRVFHSIDGGETWTVAQTPVGHRGDSSGVFSIVFLDGLHGIAVGGDYAKPEETAASAVTSDGGKTWTEGAPLPGYRSAVVCSETACLTTGASGSERSSDGGRSWKPVAGSYNAMSLPWAVGPAGTIAKFKD